MAVETMYNTSYTSPTNTGRQEYTNVGASNFALYLEGEGGTAPIGFKDPTIAVYDVAVGGTALVKGTDYVTEIESEYHSGRAKYSVKYRVRAITHQTGSIFIDCDIVAHETSAEVINELQSGITTNATAISGLSTIVYADIYNCELSNGTDTDHDIDIATGFCYDSSLTYNMTLSSGLTKQLDATWAVGTNVGGLFSGTVANSTTYHTFLIRKDSDSSIDAGFDTSVTAANIPTGYTAYRRLGSFYTDGSANIVGFNHTWQDKTFKLKTKIITQSSWQVPTSATLIALDVPLGIKVNPIALFSGGAFNSTNAAFNIYSYDESPPPLNASVSVASGFNGVCGSDVSTSGGDSIYKIHFVKTNTLGQIYFIRTGTYFSSARYSTLQTHGWIDYTL